ncbi:MAG: AAA family ATPase [Candidatus Aminicenantes bacterium]|nr:AAA family ATPase [Candidatus Aminicenantes bacterium]
MFVGRKYELQQLEDKCSSSKSELVVIYGRRRIGKSSLVEKFAENKDFFYKFEGIEGENTKGQIDSFVNIMAKYIDDSFLGKIRFDSWHTVFDYLTEKVVSDKKRGKKTILFFDEVQWMAVRRGKLISTIKYFWDNHWKKMNVMLILCGSIASFMVKRIIHSKALYGRITLEMLLKGLLPHEAAQFFGKKRSSEEILKYLLVLGGVPRYLEEIDLNRSFNQNINTLCFSKNGLMVDEIDKVFYSQFKEAETYRKIVSLLKGRLLTFKEIAEKTGKPSGGTLKNSLELLINAELIDFYISVDKGWNTKFKKYRLGDEFLVFYFKYIEPNIRLIKTGGQIRLFEKVSVESLNVWLGFAFERFCLKQAGYFAGIMGFGEEMLLASPYFRRGDPGFQVDLIYKRVDRVITACEIKYSNERISTKIIPGMEKKCAALEIPRGHTLEKGLISVYGPDEALRDSCYFNHYVTVEDIVSGKTAQQKF